MDNARKYARGGLLPMSVFLTKNAPGLRTSPVKRGYWIVHRLLGEHIPAPPPDVPVLPTDETKLGDLTLRDALAQHRANPACASCHAKFDSFGLVFEGYGPVGEVRDRDLAGRAVETAATFPDGSSGSGLEGLRAFMRARGQGQFVDNLCRELLVYALGRSLLRSDEPLLAEMRKDLSTGGYKFGHLVQDIVTSRQFLTKRATPSSVGICTMKMTTSPLQRNSREVSRRRFLRGTGVVMALPWLESLPVWGAEPTAAARAQAARDSVHGQRRQSHGVVGQRIGRRDGAGPKPRAAWSRSKASSTTSKDCSTKRPPVSAFIRG